MEEIIDYIMHTPGNTNPNILREMMKNSGDGGGDGGGDGSFKVIDVSDSTTDSDYNETVYRLTEAKTAEALAVEDGTRLIFTWLGFGGGEQTACFLVYATGVGSGEEGEGPGSNWLAVLEGDPRGKTTKFISNDYETYDPK